MNTWRSLPTQAILWFCKMHVSATKKLKLPWYWFLWSVLCPQCGSPCSMAGWCYYYSRVFGSASKERPLWPLSMSLVKELSFPKALVLQTGGEERGVRWSGKTVEGIQCIWKCLTHYSHRPSSPWIGGPRYPVLSGPWDAFCRPLPLLSAVSYL